MNHIHQKNKTTLQGLYQKVKKKKEKMTGKPLFPEIPRIPFTLAKTKTNKRTREVTHTGALKSRGIEKRT